MKEDKGFSTLETQPLCVDVNTPPERGSDAEWEAFMEATQTVLTLKAGQTLTQEDIDQILFVGEYERRDEERQIDCFHRGYQLGLHEGGGSEVADLIERVSDLRTSLVVANALSKVGRTTGFVRGAQACREMVARFVGQGGKPILAGSIRLNWHPGWGQDPGAPEGDIPTLASLSEPEPADDGALAPLAPADDPRGPNQ